MYLLRIGYLKMENAQMKLNESKRHTEALHQALQVILTSNITGSINEIILYGSAARDQLKYDSDIDLLVVFDEKLKGNNDFYRKIRKLRSDLTDLDFGYFLQIDMRSSFGDTWKTSDGAYYYQIRVDGKVLWKKSN